MLSELSKKLIYIDLFAGCGGLSLGLSKADWSGLFAIEKSPDAFKTLSFNLIEKNHFDWPKWLPCIPHDIKKVLRKYQSNLIELRGKIDMVTGGPPCQGFSTVGKRNEKDQRNQLINYYIKFVKLVQPKILFFENVKGFTMEFDKNRSRGKKYSEEVIHKLHKIGYDVHPELINFAEFGIPQKRCRFILVGVRKDVCREKEIAAKDFFSLIRRNREQFLISKDLEVTVPLEAAISDLLMTNGTEPVPNSRFNIGKYSAIRGKYQAYIRKQVKEETVDSHRFANHTNPIKERFKLILQQAEKGKPISEEMRRRFHTKKRTIVPLDGKDQSPTITTLPDDYIHYCEPRILTVREYARIQSFPDSFQFKGKYTTGGKLRTQEVPRYTQVGNAVPPLFGEQSGLALTQLLHGQSSL